MCGRATTTPRPVARPSARWWSSITEIDSTMRSRLQPGSRNARTSSAGRSACPAWTARAARPRSRPGRRPGAGSTPAAAREGPRRAHERVGEPLEGGVGGALGHPLAPPPSRRRSPAWRAGRRRALTRRPRQGRTRSCRRTWSTRWPTVIHVSAARIHSRHGQDVGHAEAGEQRGDEQRGSSRSARSAMPTLHSTPMLSARALAYETTPPPTRQSEAGRSDTVSPARAKPSTRPPKIAPSATRSSVESRNAPQGRCARNPGHRAVEQVG